MLKEAIIRFAGSFQCRLGTNPDPTTTPDTPAVSSPTDPFGDIRRPAALGWTFPYSESRFDGIIRCQQPVELRNALIDPFEPVKVTGIEVKPESLGPLGFELPFQPVPVDPLLGLPVSLGEKAYFLSSSPGQGPSREALMNCQVTFGTNLSASPVSPPLLKGIETIPDWKNEYLLRKPLAMAPVLSAIEPTRLKVLQQVVSIGPGVPIPIRLENYANFFQLMEDTIPIKATIDFVPAGATGILTNLFLGWSWTLNLTFFRFDGDTLTGRLKGSLDGFRPIG